MIVHDTAINQMREIILLQVKQRPSIINQSPCHNATVKGPQNTKRDTDY